ncbi:MAG: hypothetical protein E7131_02310 [Rikenellaceae bacterium]|nr:hypothetical protein [Rikenellaceae bacterium]
MKRYKAYDVGKADNQDCECEVSHKLSTQHKGKVRGEQSTYDITQSVPQAIDIIDLSVNHKYSQREGRSDKYDEALDDIGGDDIQLHRPDCDGQQHIAQTDVDISAIEAQQQEPQIVPPTHIQRTASVDMNVLVVLIGYHI